MVIQFKLEPDAFLVCALGIAAGVLLIPFIWNKKMAARFLRAEVGTNQEFNKTSEE